MLNVNNKKGFYISYDRALDTLIRIQNYVTSIRASQKEPLYKMTPVEWRKRLERHLERAVAMRTVGLAVCTYAYGRDLSKIYVSTADWHAGEYGRPSKEFFLACDTLPCFLHNFAAREKDV